MYLWPYTSPLLAWVGSVVSDKAVLDFGVTLKKFGASLPLMYMLLRLRVSFAATLDDVLRQETG